MKLNKKGVSLIEIIISIALISILTLFMYRLLADVTFQKDNEYFASSNQETKIEILDYLHEHYAYGRIDSYKCTSDNKSCTFKKNDAEVFTFEISKSGNKNYFIIKKGSDIFKKWYLSQVYDAKIDEPTKIDDIYYISIKIYTNNLDNNEGNNNTLDDIEFTINCSENLEATLMDAFATVQCIQKDYYTDNWGYLNPSTYDFENDVSGECNLEYALQNATEQGNLKVEKSVSKFVHKPVYIDINDTDQTIYVHYCRMGDLGYIYGYYGVYGDYNRIAEPTSEEYNFNDYTGLNDIGQTLCTKEYTSGSMKGQKKNPCRTRYNQDHSNIAGYSIEFLTHYYNIEDNPNTAANLQYSCKDYFKNNVDSSYSERLYGELLEYNSTTKKREVTATCKNNECLKENGKGIWCKLFKSLQKQSECD